MSALTEKCRGRWQSILPRLNIYLSDTALRHKNTECLFCGGVDRFVFFDRDGSGSFFCRHCGSGDGVMLVMRFKGLSFREAARLIESVVGGCSTQSSSPVANQSSSPKDPLRYWLEAVSILGTRGADYYASREINLTPVEAQSLGYIPALWHWLSQSKFPCVVALVARADGTPVTVHQTFLAYDGSGKAPVEKPKLFPAGVSPLGCGVWFGVADHARELIVAEGLESTLSAMRLFNAEAGVAALSTEGMRALILPLAALRVRIFADHDELGQGLAAAVDAARVWRGEGRAVVVSRASSISQDASDVWTARCRASAGGLS
jgi:putative DNA primase/helicase